MILASCLLLLVVFGLAERIATGRARGAVPIRIHVNGTRGKSTVTRLVAAALREAGIPTLAKVTGTSPRLVLPDGSERTIVRRAPASIREQAWLLRRARRVGARAVVVECMAIRPELQWISEREMVRATIGVITNVRLDHTEVMGDSLDEIARSLASSVPRAAVLVTGERRFEEVLRARCEALGTRMIVATRASRGISAPAEGDHQRQSDWQADDEEIALAVTRELGVDDAVALRGMRKAAADPGAVSRGRAAIGALDMTWIDATAANDPESVDLIVADAPRSLSAATIISVYNHRSDRPERLRVFAQSSALFRASRHILLTGDRACVSLERAVRAACPRTDVRFVARRRVAAAVAEIVTRDAGGAAPQVIFCGNTRGWTNDYLAKPSPCSARAVQATDDQDYRPTTQD